MRKTVTGEKRRWLFQLGGDRQLVTCQAENTDLHLAARWTEQSAGLVRALRIPTSDKHITEQRAGGKWKDSKFRTIKMLAWVPISHTHK